MTMRIETREVLAVCYLGPNKGPHTGSRMLSHACEVDDSGRVRRVLCKRVSELSIADRHAQDTSLAPTCEHCQSRLRALDKVGR